MGEVTKVVTFFEGIGSWLKSKFKKLPAFEVVAASAINYCVPVVEELDTLFDPSLAVVVNPILDRIKTGFAAAAVTIQGSMTAAGVTNLKSILASISANMAALESAAGIKDAATQSKFSAIITLLQGELSAINAAATTVNG